MTPRPNTRRRPAPPRPTPRPTPGVASREAALRLLIAVLLRHQPLELAMEQGLAGLDDPSDRGLAHAIVSATLRWLPDLDAMIDSATPKPLPHDARARLVLRMALAQVLALGTPPHAAVATALPLVEAGPRRLVHAVLGRLLREGVCLPDRPTLPQPYASRWLAAFGPDAAHDLAEALKDQPPLDICLRDPSQTQTYAESLGGQSLLPGHVRVPAGAPVTTLPGYDDGAWWVQDIAAGLPARLIDARPGQSIADLCAAPGGKTLQLAATGAHVTAVDSSARRLERLRENLARTGLAADVVVADATTWRPDQQFDAVLLDAPCSATGTFRRHPDVLHLKAGRDTADLLDLQRRLLAHAATLVRPGGTLVYAVCSLEAEEGLAQIEQFLKAHSTWQRAVPSDAERGPFPHTPQGDCRTRPGDPALPGGCDGFFVSRLRAP